MTSVQVVVRLRPMNGKETKEGTLPMITASTSNKSVTVIKGVGAKQARSQFTFDNVFTSFSNQQDVFSVTLRPIITDVLKGFETCVFAYGQTGTGKTHTMEGNLEDPDQYGVIPRAAQSIFDALQSSHYIETKVSCSYLEIYNEELSDLLVTNHSKKLDIINGGAKQGVHCRGLEQIPVQSAEDVLQLMQSAVQTRRVGETSMNKQSSRSHCIFTMRVETKKKLPDGSVFEAQGKLHMVDLAGSESAKTATLEQSSAKQQATREQERRNINKSLLALGRVISMLKEQSDTNKKTAIIPYRDSKLTRILQEALGGRCKTVIIATISPSVINLQESLQTLHYAQTANGIKNKPISTSYMSMSSSSASMPLSHDGPMTVAVERWQEMEIRMEHMQQEVEEARHALARNYMQQQEFVDRAEKAEQAQQELQFDLEAAGIQITTLTGDLNDERNAKEAVQTQLHHSEVALKKTAAVLKATQQTEQSLTSEALVLLQALKDSVADGDTLYDMVQARREDEVERRCATRDFHQSIATALKDAVSNLDNIVTSDKENQAVVGEAASIDHQHRIEAIDEAQAVVSKIAALVADLSGQVSDSMSNDMIPKVDLLATRIKSSTEETRAIITDGDTELSSSCAAARHQLESFATVLQEMNTQHNKATEDSLSNVEQAIMETKAKVESMVKTTGQAIQIAQDHSLETRATLNNVLKDWKGAGSVATAQVIEISAAQHRALENSYNLLNSEMKRHHTMNKELESQVDFLSAKQDYQLGKMENQYTQLGLQQRQLEIAKASQASLCNTVMNTVIDGVKNLVTEQLKLVIADQVERTAELIRSNCSVTSLNEEGRGASVEMFDGLITTNTALREEAKSMHETDASVLTALDTGRSAIANVHQVAENHQIALENYATAAEEEMNTLETDVHADIAKVRDQMYLAGELCAEQMDKNTDVASESISQLAEIGSTAMSFSRDEIVKKATASLAKIEEPCAELLSQVSQNLKSMEETTGDGAKEAVRLVKKHLEAIAETNTSVARSADYFNSTTCEHHRSQSNAASEKTTATMKSHGVAAKVFVSDCRDHIVGAADKSHEFGHAVIKMDTEVEAAPKRTNIDYDEDLTSTPDEEVVLKGIGFGTVEPSTESVLDTTATTEENTSIDDTSETSFVSTTKSPVLRENSLNRQADAEVSKVSPGKRRRGTTSLVPRRTKHKV